jgi:S-ribosylhomocysteine lyase LuxS involved in autoinducer biosynthesis
MIFMRKRFIQDIADMFINQFGLSDWGFSFDKAKMRCGACRYAKKKITISIYFVMNPDIPFEVIRDVILHECAHALVGHEHAHNDVWRAKAVEIGCSGCRTYNYSTGASPNIFAMCRCGRTTIWRHRMSKKLLKSSCKACGTRLHVTRLKNELST